MLSGKFSAQVIHEAFVKNDFSENTLKEYEKRLHDEIDRELNSSYRMQRLGSIRPILNWIVRKAAKNQHAKDLIASTLANETARNEFTSPLLYLKILFS